ncbi:hypothetical protein KAR91_41435 [Candidatus Pacearchaeota archaeon]|nr:hypothetical protein [Candidatus Pacearchaeota archaeon]
MSILSTATLIKDYLGVKIPQWYNSITESFVEVSDENPLPTRITDGTNVLNIGANSGADVNIQDQTTPTIILPMVHQLGLTTLSVDTVLNAYIATVTSVSGFVVGQHFRIINSAADRYYFGTILSIDGNNITLDTQMDFVYVAGSEITISNINMAVDGSVTPVIFTLRTGSPSIPSSVDMTRLIITCTTTTAVDLNKFGDLTALTRGLAFRRVDGVQSNIFNVKANKDLAGLAYDFQPYVASNPSQGIDGFACRLTFAGQNKIGVALRVDQYGNLEMIVQDDLTSLVSLVVMLEGHVVEEN